ncbi:MAG: TonB-dependent receptor plug domain-containing protein [Gammaproteobacteria bacterium AqS3]|nr:TonB-dependent receptor plug domain-containing protein [Gammaproteobacteria bacterium AqS3]
MKTTTYFSSLGLLLGSLFAIPLYVHAQEGEDSYEASDLEEIVVLGTRRTDRTVTESAGPIDIFTPEQLNNSVLGDFRDTLRKNIPSFNVTRNPLSDAPSLSRPTTLRGLSPDHTLILLNGTRRHRGAIVHYSSFTAVTQGSQPVDFGGLPSIGLARLEVLRDGASAQYGSDAIAGVMNVVLREDVDIFELRVGGGLYDRKNDGENNKLQAYAGFAMPRDGFLTFALEADTSALTSRGREHPGVTALKADSGSGSAKFYNDTRQAKPVAGDANAATLIFGDAILSDPTDRSSIVGFGAMPIDTSLTGNPYSDNLPTMTWGDPDTKNARMMVNFGFQINEDARFFANLTAADMEAEIDFYWRTPIDRGGIIDTPDIQRGRAVNSGGTGFQDYDDATYGANNTRIADSYTEAQHNALLYMDARGLYPGGYVPIMGGESADSSMTIGVEGTYSGWDYRVTLGGGTNTIDFFLGNSINPSIYPESTVPITGDDRVEVGSQAHRDDLARRAAAAHTEFDIGSLEQEEGALHVDFSKIFETKTGELSLAWGFEGRRETYSIGAGERAAWDYTRDTTYGATQAERDRRCQEERDKADDHPDGKYVGKVCNDQLYKGMVVGSHGLPGFAPSDAGSWSRTAVAAYVDMEVDLSADTVLGLAYRVEDYEDFGETRNGKVSVTSAVTERVNWRSTASTGFRAPTLGQSWTSVTRTNLVSGQLVQSGILPPTSDASRIKGAKPLEPETSRNISFGFTGELGDRGGIWSVDFYNIRVEDRIALSADLPLKQAEKDELQKFIGPGAQSLNSLQFFTNDIDTETQGLDLVLSAPISETWKYTLAYNRNRTEVTDYSTGEGAPFTPNLVYQMENQTPEQRLNLTFNFDSALWGQEIAFSYYGRWADFEQSDFAEGPPFKGKSALLVDLAWYVKIAGRNEIRWGAENLFDHYPERVDDSPTFSGHQYNSYIPYGFNGRFLYVRYSFTYEGSM